MAACQPDILALRRGLARGETTASALTQTALASAQESAALNAFVSLNPEGARQAARRADARRLPLGPLDGIPVAVKDNFSAAGMVTTRGHRADSLSADELDAHAVARLIAAGAVIIGKTNLDEGALGAVTDNPHHGRSINPLADGHTPGGSSGGSAAAVAAGIVPLALGSDTLGSVRIPASYCGLFALKPTRGAIGRSGLAPLAESLDSAGPIGRSVPDLRLAYDILSGYDPEDLASVPPSLRSIGAPRARSDPLTVGVVNLDGVALEGAIDDALALAVDALAAGGARVRPIAIEGWHPARAGRAGFLVVEAEVAAALGEEIAAEPDRFGATFLKLVDYGRRLEAPRLARAYATVRATAAAVLRAFAEVDVLLLPTTPHRSFLHGTPPPVDQADLTALANLAGCPAVAIPVRTTDGALPASIQLLGPSWSEHWLLDLAEVLALQLDAVR